MQTIQTLVCFTISFLYQKINEMGKRWFNSQKLRGQTCDGFRWGAELHHRLETHIKEGSNNARICMPILNDLLVKSRWGSSEIGKLPSWEFWGLSKIIVPKKRKRNAVFFPKLCTAIRPLIFAIYPNRQPMRIWGATISDNSNVRNKGTIFFPYNDNCKPVQFLHQRLKTPPFDHHKRPENHQKSRKKTNTQVLPSDLFGGFKWPLQGLSDLHLGNQKVTWKKLDHVFFVSTFCVSVRFVWVR